jgi:hypothetical protein
MDFPVNKPLGPQAPKPSQPIPFDRNSDKPIPFDIGDTSQPGISHSPLDLGVGAAEARKIAMPKPILKPQERIVSADRITGLKTFFTKLHPGALEFLDEQISAWLKQNPGIVIKRTNVTTGEVQAKKSEPNIIITVWY